MKRILRTAAWSFVFLSICSLTCWLAYFTNITKFWTMFGIASGVLGVGIVFSCIKNFTCRTLAFLINAVAMGFYLQAWYIDRGFHNSFWLIWAMAVLATLYIFLFALPLLLPPVNNHYGVYTTLFVLLSLAGYVALVVLTKTTWVSTLGYYGIVQLGFILGCSFKCDDKDDEAQAALISTYSVLVCGIIILALVLGGDSCDGSCECSADDIGSPVQRKPKVKDPNQPSQ